MADALEVRVGERQRLLESLQEELWNWEDNIDHNSQNLEYTLAMVCTKYLRDRVVQPTIIQVEIFFFEIILSRISEFSRAEEEKLALVADFLKWLVTSATSDLQARLARKQSSEPRVIFHADSATSRI